MLCQSGLGMDAPDGSLVTAVCLGLFDRMWKSRGVYMWPKISTITSPDSLNEDKTQMLVLFCVMSFCTRLWAQMCASVCLSSKSHPPPLHPCAHIPKVISSLVLTRLDRLPSVIWSVAFVPVGYCNDSCCEKNPTAVCSQSKRMKGREEDESVTGPVLYKCILTQLHEANTTKVGTRVL